MRYAVILRNFILVAFASLLLTACAAQKKVSKIGQMQSDVYTGSATVEYLETGV